MLCEMRWVVCRTRYRHTLVLERSTPSFLWFKWRQRPWRRSNDAPVHLEHKAQLANALEVLTAYRQFMSGAKPIEDSSIGRKDKWLLCQLNKDRVFFWALVWPGHRIHTNTNEFICHLLTSLSVKHWTDIFAKITQTGRRIMSKVNFVLLRVHCVVD